MTTAARMQIVAALAVVVAGVALVALLGSSHEVAPAPTASAEPARAVAPPAAPPPRVRAEPATPPATDAAVATPAAAVDSKVPVRVVVLGVDATPETRKVIVTVRDEPDAESSAHLDWTPDAPTLSLRPGERWLTAEVPGEAHAPAVRVVVASPMPDAPVTLRLVSGPATAPLHRYEDVVFPDALHWFLRRQAADGSWVGAEGTGLALLVFLGGGDTPTSGSGVAREAVKKGLDFLKDAVGADGRIVPKDAPRSLRAQAIAGLALIEAYGMTGSRSLLEPSQRVVRFAQESVAPSGGWNLPAPDADVLDVETTGFMVMTLKSAQMSDIAVAPNAIRDAVGAIERVTDPASGRVTPPSAAGSTLSADAATAIGAVSRIFAGRTTASDPVLERAATLLAAKLPDAASPDPLYVYFGTLAAFQLGDEVWRPWNAALQTAVLDRQRADAASDDRGSWDAPTDAERVFVTALATLCTEVRLRYRRVAPK